MVEQITKLWRQMGTSFGIEDSDGYTVVDEGSHSNLTVLDHIVACHNALAGLNPEKVKALVEAATAVDNAVVADELTVLPILLVRLRVALAELKAT